MSTSIAINNELLRKYEAVLMRHGIPADHQMPFALFAENGTLESLVEPSAANSFLEAVNAGRYDDAVDEAFAIRFAKAYEALEGLGTNANSEAATEREVEVKLVSDEDASQGALAGAGTGHPRRSRA